MELITSMYEQNSLHSTVRYVGCPSGLGLGFARFQNMTLLVCHETFYADAQARIEQDNQSNAIIIGSIVGPLGGLILIALLIAGIKQLRSRGPVTQVITKDKDTYTAIVPQVNPLTPKEKVAKLLSPGGMHDFEYGLLSAGLRTELMILRLKEGRELTEFVQYAEHINCTHIASFVRELNPGMIPRNIQQQGPQYGTSPYPTAPV